MVASIFFDLPLLSPHAIVVAIDEELLRRVETYDLAAEDITG